VQLRVLRLLPLPLLLLLAFGGKPALVSCAKGGHVGLCRCSCLAWSPQHALLAAALSLLQAQCLCNVSCQGCLALLLTCCVLSGLHVLLAGCGSRCFAGRECSGKSSRRNYCWCCSSPWLSCWQHQAHSPAGQCTPVGQLVLCSRQAVLLHRRLLSDLSMLHMALPVSLELLWLLLLLLLAGQAQSRWWLQATWQVSTCGLLLLLLQGPCRALDGLLLGLRWEWCC
jgi:hypothetical protein